MPKQAMGDLERAIWLLVQTDDYEVIGQGEGWAELIYVHNDPPHPVTRIEMLDANAPCGDCGGAYWQSLKPNASPIWIVHAGECSRHA